jgi:hypothetical protein
LKTSIIKTAVIFFIFVAHINKKMKTTLLTLSLCVLLLIAKAQERTVTIEAKRNENKSIDFDYNKTDPGTHTVVIKFASLSNTMDPGASFTASDYSGRLFSLTPSNKDQGIGYGSYTTFYIRGKLKPKYNPNFIYVLPYKNEAKVQVAESGFLGATYFGKTAPEDWKAYRFYTTEQDTVSAIRKGLVVEVKDLYETGGEDGLSYTSKVNELTIEHTDGTMAIYKGFKKGSFTVKVGQTVFPGTSLGLNSKYDRNGKYNVSIMVTYLKSLDVDKTANSTTKSNSYYGFITPRFMTANNADEVLVAQKIYMAASTADVVQKEMTKKELKLLGKPKK